MNQNYGPMPWEELLARIPSMQSSPALADVLGLRKKAQEQDRPPMMAQGYGSIPSPEPMPPPQQPKQSMQSPQSMQPVQRASPYDDPVDPEVMASADRVSAGWGGADTPDRPAMSRYSDLNTSGFGNIGGLLFGKESLRGGTAYDEDGNFRGMFPMAKGLLSKIFDTEG
jgi:hypothetical protein